MRDGKQLGGATRRDDYWGRMYDDLCAYEKENGDCLVSESEGNKSLRRSRWVYNQRTQAGGEAVSSDR